MKYVLLLLLSSILVVYSYSQAPSKLPQKLGNRGTRVIVPDQLSVDSALVFTTKDTIKLLQTDTGAIVYKDKFYYKWIKIGTQYVWYPVDKVDLSNSNINTVFGTLPIGNGGTGSTSFTAGSIPFMGGSGTLSQDNTRLFWDNTNKRLGIGINSPDRKVVLQDDGSGGGVQLRITDVQNSGNASLGAVILESGGVGSNQSQISATNSDIGGYPFLARPGLHIRSITNENGIYASIQHSASERNALFLRGDTVGIGWNHAFTGSAWGGSGFGGYPVVIGSNSSGTGVAVGYSAVASNFEAVAVGPQARATGLATIAIGDGAQAEPAGPNGNEIVIGDALYGKGNVNWLMGGGCGTSADFICAIGACGSSTSYNSEIATGNHQGYLGWYQHDSPYFSGGDGAMNDWVLGGPMQASAPHGINLRMTSGLGTHKNGINFGIYGSRGTGLGVPGNIVFYGADSTIAGSDILQDSVPRFTISGYGILKIHRTPDTASVATGGFLFRDATTGEVRVSSPPDVEVTSTISTYTNYTTTATYQNITSITLPAGDWDISAQGTFSSNGATITAASDAIFVISTTTASAAGSTEGKNIAYVSQATLLGTSHQSVTITPYLVSPSSSTTYYLNTQSTFTAGNPQFVGTIRARRIK